MSPDRVGVIAGNLARVRDRIATACVRAGRSPGEITLIAVTKTYPASDVLALAGLGVYQVGENRDQEAAGKAAQVAAAGVDVVWHFVGQLQRNKCRSVVRYAGMVHSVDRVALAQTLAEQAHRHAPRPLPVLVQVSIDGDAARGGALRPGAGADRDSDLARVLATVAGAPALQLRGLMAVAPLGWRPEVAYQRLADVAAGVRAEYPSATLLSAGMSADMEAAIDYGATHVRVGSALLGNRAPLG